MKKAKQKFKPIPFFMDDAQAEKVGFVLAREFHLKRSREYGDRWETNSGTFTNKGIARRAHRIIQENL
jgi:hypothetical protein